MEFLAFCDKCNKTTHFIYAGSGEYYTWWNCKCCGYAVSDFESNDDQTTEKGE